MHARLSVKHLLWIGVLALVIVGSAIRQVGPPAHALHHAVTATGGALPIPEHGAQQRDGCPFCRLVAAFVLPEALSLPRYIRYPQRVSRPTLQAVTLDFRYTQWPIGARAPPPVA